jgi:formylmethanofuran dehydrogenase subunit C
VDELDVVLVVETLKLRLTVGALLVVDGAAKQEHGEETRRGLIIITAIEIAW